MNRRAFLKGSAALAAISGFRLPLAHAADYAGKLCVFVQADGGWDPTSFCDPKTNTPGEPIINHWAERDEARRAGGIRYAPFAGNEAFFKKYHRRMLVINGVDAQTNSHSVGIVHNWSGRTSEGYPATTALLAAHGAPELSVSYINFGGYAETGGLIRFARLHDPDLLGEIAYPHGESELREGDDRVFIWPEERAVMERYRAAAVRRLAARENLLPGESRRLAHYAAAFASSEGLKTFADALPPRDQLEQPVEAMIGNDRFWSQLRRQAQLTVLAFKTGVSVSADLYLNGFDTHARNDARQAWLMANLTDGVDYLWEYAEQHGVADRLFVMIGSDFGRTNFYNSEDGKDHWPIGSYVIMEKNQPWTNRVVGETDELHFARRINLRTLKRDDRNGTIIHPKHVHKALRRYLGVENSAGAKRFPFNNTEDLRVLRVGADRR